MLASVLILAAVLVAMFVFHVWSARQWSQERATLTTELTNLAIARSSTDLRVLRTEPPLYPDRPVLPEGFENLIGL